MEASKAPTLWALTNAIAEVGAMIAEAGGEIDPSLEALLDGAKWGFEEKVEEVALYVRHVELLAENAKAEKDRLAKIQRHFESQAGGLKKYLLACMDRADVKSIETHRVRVRVQRAGVPAITYNGPIDELPSQFVRVVPETLEINRAALADHFTTGGTLPDGVRAAYSYSVRIS